MLSAPAPSLASWQCVHSSIFLAVAFWLFILFFCQAASFPCCLSAFQDCVWILPLEGQWVITDSKLGSDSAALPPLSKFSAKLLGCLDEFRVYSSFSLCLGEDKQHYYVLLMLLTGSEATAVRKTSSNAASNTEQINSAR